MAMASRREPENALEYLKYEQALTEADYLWRQLVVTGAAYYWYSEVRLQFV
jgi:hypothetical protein